MNNKTEHNNSNIKYAYFASGCFWGTEYWFSKAKGVIEVLSGYTGGNKSNPTYEEVCTGLTGHLEGVSVKYLSNETSYDELVKLFFETHNYSQENGQGVDIGSQYLSAIFYETDDEKTTALKYINILKNNGERVATNLIPFTKFWVAESYHQKHFDKLGLTLPCHSHNKILW